MVTTLKKFSTIVDCVRYQADSQPEKIAFTWLLNGETPAENLTYQKIDQLAQGVATYLNSLELTGKPVMLLYPPGIEIIASYFGCLYVNAIPISASPPNPNQSLTRIEAIIADSKTTVILTTSFLLSYLKTRFAESSILSQVTLIPTDNLDLKANFNPISTSPDSLACLAYTSGSTGVPKGIMLSHKNIMENLVRLQERLDFNPDSKLVSWMPFDHNAGIVGSLLLPIYSNFPVILMSPLDFLTKPSRWLEAISRYQGTFSLAPNFAYNLVCEKMTPKERDNLNLKSWNVALWGSETIRVDIVERFFKTFAPYGLQPEAFVSSYGLSEIVSLASLSLKTDVPVIQNIDKKSLEENRCVFVEKESENTKKIISCGQPLIQQKLIIVNPKTLTQCSPQEVGEIWISSPCVAQGYWQRPEATAETFNAYLTDTQEGPFLRTGDLGFLNNGELFITGRVKDIIIIRGLNHYPQDIEQTVENSNPNLQPNSTAAFSIEVANEEGLVIISELQEKLEENVDFKTIIYNIREIISKQHGIQVYSIVLLQTNSIPKSPTGKIQRHNCRLAFLNKNLTIVAQWTQDISPKLDSLSTSDSSQEKSKAINEQHRLKLRVYIQEQISQALGIPTAQIDMTKPLTHLGLDSLMIAELKNRISTTFKVEISVATFVSVSSLENLVEIIVPQLQNSNDLETFLKRGEKINTVISPQFSFCLLPLQPKGSQSPLFLVHPLMGIVWPYHKLATLIGEDQPVFGFQAIGIDDNNKPLNSIEKMAAYYIEILKAVQPQGPYYLGGWSLGALIAYEMARQLEQAGEKIALLALLDMTSPSESKSKRFWFSLKFAYTQVLPSFLPDLYQYWKQNRIIFDQQKTQLDLDQQTHLKASFSEFFKRWKQLKYRIPSIQRLMKVIQNNIQAQINYAPLSYNGKITLLRISQSWDGNSEDPTYGWSQLTTGGVDTFLLPGNHLNLLTEPYVHEFASQLKCLLSNKDSF